MAARLLRARELNTPGFAQGQGCFRHRNEMVPLDLLDSASGPCQSRAMSRTLTYSGDEPVRVNKFMAQNGLCSRREAEDLIQNGHVLVNGATISEPGHKINPGETLELKSGGEVKLQNKICVLIHKPVGIVSAQPDPGQVPAARLLTKANLRGPKADVMPGKGDSLPPLGRLDMDSRGLLILSDDGVLAKALIGPESGLEKDYRVKVKGTITPDKIAKLCFGLNLDDRPLKRAKVTQVGDQTLRFILREGRNRQIRRMAELVDLRVVDLFRTRIGPLKLGNLREGKWRFLTADERATLIRASKFEPPSAGKGTGQRIKPQTKRPPLKRRPS